jgi:peptidoglycan L-alanyl-D-glutamate endopeptidase CwlK
MPQDQFSIDKIKVEAHPKLRAELLVIYNEANNLLGKSRLRFAQILRTFSQQTALYNQRPKVTNAKAGQTYHNYGLAVDIVMMIDKDGNGTFETASWDTKADWDNDKIADWQEVVNVFKKYGWEWGGDWVSFKDLPHFQKTFGYNWRQLLAIHDAGRVDAAGFIIF